MKLVDSIEECSDFALSGALADWSGFSFLKKLSPHFCRQGRGFFQIHRSRVTEKGWVAERADNGEPAKWRLPRLLLFCVLRRWERLKPDMVSLGAGASFSWGATLAMLLQERFNSRVF